jgi:hypothetical protein
MSGLLQVATMGWPVHILGQDTMQPGLWTHALGLIYTQAGGTRENFNFLSKLFFLSYKWPCFKVGTLVFQVGTLKDNKTAPSWVLLWIQKTFGFFFPLMIIKGSFAEINSTG